MTAEDYTGSTDREILRSLGRRMRALRTSRGLTQQEAADRADLARSTVSEVERGENPTLHTVVRLLRVYGRLAALETFIPEPELSPMARLRERKERAGRRDADAAGEAEVDGDTDARRDTEGGRRG